ncbi:MAG: HDIG domain-containing protein, partial [bacterium]|nr:HDIG domain-containing protein [bacterium]
MAFWLLGVALTLLLSILITAPVFAPSVSYQVGDVAQRDVKAPHDIRLEDLPATESLRQKARDQVLPHYDVDSKYKDAFLTRIRGAFIFIRSEIAKQKNLIEKGREKQPGTKSPLGEAALLSAVYASVPFQEAERAFGERLGGELSPELRRWFRSNQFSDSIMEEILEVVRALLSQQVVSDRALYRAHLAKGIIVRDIQTGERVSLRLSSRPLELREVESFMLSEAVRTKGSLPRPLRRPLFSRITRHIKPTLTFNNKATVEAQREAAEALRVVSVLIKKGEMIVREGERITEGHIARLSQLQSFSRQTRIVDNLAGSALIIALLMFLSWICAWHYQLSFLQSRKNLFLFIILVAAQALLIKAGLIASELFSETYSFIPLDSFYYAIPFASATMLVALLQGRSPAVLMGVISGGLTALIVGGDVQYTIVALAGSILAAIRWKNYRHRSSILVAGLMVGLLSGALALGFNIQEGLRTAIARWMDVPIALLGGIFNVIIVSAAMPFLESIFKLTTDMRLLELSDLNHPLLRKLVVRAPGTYHHSIMVGNLAEEAAEAIGANPLLTRVGAYFHDIGKMLKPEYFIENQGDENRHDRLSPSMSALVLISHVKDGLEMGRAEKLPPEILDFIQQHHGASLIRFFYEKAVSEAGEGVETSEASFRYPGPRPQTREAGIMMLADMAEATSRAVGDNSPARLAGIVERVVQTAFSDGQLDQCDLTLRDLGRIREAFLRVLAGIYHHRISYPEPVGAERKGTHDGNHLKQAKTGETRSSGPPGEGRGSTR